MVEAVMGGGTRIGEAEGQEEEKHDQSKEEEASFFMPDAQEELRDGAA